MNKKILKKYEKNCLQEKKIMLVSILKFSRASGIVHNESTFVCLFIILPKLSTMLFFFIPQSKTSGIFSRLLLEYISDHYLNGFVMLFFKRFSMAGFALLAFFCSAFVFDEYLDKILDAKASESASIHEKARENVEKMYPEFLKIVQDGASKDQMAKFFKDNFDTAAISRRLSGTNSDILINSLIDFLIWRLKTEAIQKVSDYELQGEMSFTVKKNSIHVACSLKSKKTNEDLRVIAVFAKSKSHGVGKLLDIVVVGIPLIEGTIAAVKNSGTKLTGSADERAKTFASALDSFVLSQK